MRATPVVEISFTTDPADAPVWVDVTDRLRGFATSRGRQHELDRYQAGTGAVLLSNRDRALDPTYEAGAYYPNVLPMRRVRLSMDFPAGYAQTVLNDSPVGYWRLGESSGTSAADASGNGNTGTYTGGVTLAQAGALAAELDGTSDTAALFNGTSGYVVVPGAFSDATALTSFSFGCWAKPTSLAPGVYRGVITKNRPAGSNYYGLWQQQTTGRWYVAGAGGGSITAPATGGWDYLVVVQDGALNTKTLYVNGVAGASGAATLVSNASGADLWIGRGDTAEWFAGSIDEPFFEPTALSAARVAAHYAAGRDQRMSDLATYRVLTGFVDGYPQTWPGQVDALAEVPFTDGFKVLALATVGGTFPEQNTGDRVDDLLDDAGWPAADRDIATGQSDIQEVVLAQSTALANLQLTEVTENGRLYVTKEGLLKFADRHEPLLPPADESLALFGDGGGDELPYADLRISFDDTNLWNKIRVAREGGTTQIAEDSTSQDRYFPRTLSIDTLIVSDSEAADAAAWLLNRYAEPALRADELVVKPMKDDRLWPVVLDLELGDRITVRKRPPGGGDAIERDVIIEGIRWEYDLQSFVWRARVSPANVEANWAVWGLATWGVSKWAY